MIHGTITMNFEKDSLLEILKRNRKQHAKDANEAKVSYRAALLTILRSKIAQLEADRTPSRRIDLEPPFDYLRQYDEVIEMLEMTEDNQIALTTDQFRRYAKDDWPMKDQFRSLKTSYDSHLQ